MADSSLAGDEFQRLFNEKIGLGAEKEIQQKGKEFLNTKNKRRSKKDKTGRNYICGCGKEYLSYPALYTHIKTKHGGAQPDGTKAHLASNSKRGRPKKVDMRGQDDARTNPDKDQPPLIINFSHQQSTNKLDQFSILTDFVEKGDLRILNDYDLSGECDPTLGFPIIKFCNDDQPTYHPFHVIINNLKSENRSESLLNNNHCDTIMGMFLFAASKIVNEKLYLILGIFFRNLRECLNEHGYDVIADYFENNHSEEAKSLIPKKKDDRVFCAQETPDFLPLISDKFILEYLPKYCADFDQQLAMDLMLDFSRWLSTKKFTKIKVSFNDEENFEARDEEEQKIKIEHDNYVFGRLK